MNNGQKQFHRLLRVLLPIVILSGIMIGSFSVSRAQIGAQTAHNYVKATVTAILQDDADGLPFNGSQLVRARLTSGTWKGEEVELSNSNSYQRGALCQKARRSSRWYMQGSDGIISGSVYNYDRTGMLWGLLALFLISLLAVGGWKGAGYDLRARIYLRLRHLPLSAAALCGLERHRGQRTDPLWSCWRLPSTF